MPTGDHSHLRDAVARLVLRVEVLRAQLRNQQETIDNLREAVRRRWSK